ncbi:MAG: hypothetical protein HGB36_09375 [Chlorobiaceae bacterium]|nr:hypothetical protein [Chlorobiaceae bacterium]
MIKTKSVKIFSGYVEGFRQPSVAVEFQVSKDADEGITAKKLLKFLGPYLPIKHIDELKSNSGNAIEAILTVIYGMLISAGIPVLEPFKIGNARNTSLSKKEQSVSEVLLPSYEPHASLHILEWILKLLNNPESGNKHLTPTLRSDLDQLIQRLQAVAPAGTNNIRFINAAFALGIPVLSLPGSVFQYGWGSRGRLFFSSISDETSAYGVRQSKNKLITNATLKLGGLPVPEGYRVRNPSEAVSAAKQIGFPVVVKPADCEKGIGVSADLRTAHEVLEAFESAGKLSSELMVEKFIKGTTFRITLVQGEPVSIIKRLPAGVTGDGVHSVYSLVELANRDPRRSTAHFSIMKPLVIDNEARFLLERERLNLNSVPAAGAFISLKRAANVSTGGDVIMLKEEEIDHSYINLTKLAVELLRLDIAAVDFISGDIGKPWHETDTVIIEVNSQPQMGTILTHLHGQILESYVQGNGTIPSLLVFGSDPADLISNARNRVSPFNPGLGTSSSEGVFVGEFLINQTKQSPVAATRSLLVNPKVTSLIIATDPDALVTEGMPLPFCNEIVITTWPEKRELSPKVLSLFDKHLLGKVWIEQGHPLQHKIQELIGRERMRVFESVASMLTTIEQVLAQAGQKKVI